MTLGRVMIAMVTVSFCVTFVNGNVPVVTAIVNQSASFSCNLSSATELIHWRRNGLDYIYTEGHYYKSYKQRFSVNLSTEVSTLSISPVLTEDAGEYICEDGGFTTDLQLSSYLTVLEGDPICKSNIRTDGFIGPNSCVGIAPDVVELSCTSRFHGKSPPQVTIKKKTGESRTPHGSITTSASENNLTYTLKLEADPALDNSSYSCQTVLSNGDLLECEYDVISIINVNNNMSTVNKTIGEKVMCSDVHVSRNCSYTWRGPSNSHGDTNVPISSVDSQKSFKFQQSGTYRCGSVCIVNGVRCASPPIMTVHVDKTEEVAQNSSYLPLISIPVLVVVVLLPLAVIYLYRRRRRSGKKPTHKEQHLLGSSHEMNGKALNMSKWKPVLRETIPAKDKNPVFGLAILDDELFIATDRSSVIEARKLNELSSSRQFKVEGLVCAYNMVSCTSNKCLYMHNFKDEHSLLEILKVDANGNVMTKWSTIQDAPESLSVTYDKTLIFATFEEVVTWIHEYYPDGRLKQKIQISPDTQIVRILSVIKLSDDQFLLSHGSIKYGNPFHRVCLVKVDENKVDENKVDENKVIKTVVTYFGGSSGSSEEELCIPMDMIKTIDGSIMVADRENSRVMLLDADLNFKRVLLSGKCTRLRKPMSLCLDESRGMLFVADNIKLSDEAATPIVWGDGRILVFGIKQSELNLNCMCNV